MTALTVWQTDDSCPSCGALLRVQVAAHGVDHPGVRLRLVGHLAGRHQPTA